MNRAGLDRQPRDVARMFDAIAERYDLTNDVLAVGQTRLWRRLVRDAVGARPRDRVLDIAAGTGTSSLPFAKRGVHVVAGDFSLGMLAQGRRQYGGKHADLAFAAADATRLPFADQSFDAVTMSFGLRNVAEPSVALSEFYRVTKPGGRLVICEFSRPTNRVFAKVYEQYLLRLLPALATKVASDPESYVYLSETIMSWPEQRELGQMLRGAGWRQVEWRNLTGGVVALHRGVRPVQGLELGPR